MEDREQTIKAFKEAVNMTARQIEKWLQSDDSKRVGQTRRGRMNRSGISRVGGSRNCSARRRRITPTGIWPT